jgi:hypothetical protein
MMKMLQQHSGTLANRVVVIGRTGLIAGTICLAVMGGIALSPLSNVQAEVRSPTSLENVPSTATQTVPILQDIAATLRQIDGRLARLERMAAEASGPVSSTGIESSGQ